MTVFHAKISWGSPAGTGAKPPPAAREVDGRVKAANPAPDQLATPSDPLAFVEADRPSVRRAAVRIHAWHPNHPALAARWHAPFGQPVSARGLVVSQEFTATPHFAAGRAERGTLRSASDPHSGQLHSHPRTLSKAANRQMMRSHAKAQVLQWPWGRASSSTVPTVPTVPTAAEAIGDSSQPPTSPYRTRPAAALGHSPASRLPVAALSLAGTSLALHPEIAP